MRRFTTLFGSLFLLLTLSIVQPVQAQSADSDSLIDQLQALFENEALSFGALLQSQAEVHWDPEFEGENTFRVADARFKIYGKLDENFSYALQTRITDSPGILDANIKYATDDFSITAGAQKPGISAEFLTPASSTDFVNRSRVVTSLVNRRDIGLLAKVALSPAATFSAGMFNGTNQRLENSNNTFYYTGRLVFSPDVGNYTSLTIGANAAHSIESGTGGTQIGNGFLPAVFGKRTIYGGDIRIESGQLLLSSELLMAELRYGPLFPPVNDEVTGYHITGGYWVTENAQLLLRFDHLESDLVDIPAEDILLAGLNWNWTDTTSFQFNYQIDTDDADFANHFWLAQVQVAF